MTDSTSPGTQPSSQDRWSDPERWRRAGDISSLVWGIILVAVGGWFFVEQTLGYDLPNIEWGTVWPIVLIVLGGWVVIRAMSRRST
jgi:hypothetical protein